MLGAFAGLYGSCRLACAEHSCSHRLCLPLPLHRTPLPAFHPSPSLSFPFPLFTLSSGRAQAAVGAGYGNLQVLGTGFRCWLPNWSPVSLEVGQNQEKPFSWPPLLFTRTRLSHAPSFLLGREPSCFGWVWGNRNSMAAQSSVLLCRSSLRASVVEQETK